MNQKLLFSFFLLIAFNVDAGMWCDMYGQEDVLCQSERLFDNDITGRMKLDDKCYKGDDAACRELARRRKKIKNDDARKASVQQATKQSLNKLLSAPESITLGGRRLVLEAYLWRNFMPPSPPEGKALRASLKIKTVNNTILPKGIVFKSMWVINYRTEQLWSPEEPSVEYTLQKIEITAHNGPKWDSNLGFYGFYIVVVQMNDVGDKIYLLKTIVREIHRTY